MPTLVEKTIQSTMSASISNFSGTPSYNFQDSQNVVPMLGNRPSCNHIFYNFLENLDI